ncbi:glycosyltransferase family 39 protein [Nisaea acidiphila]|uniref:Glycosyltransferase family 39 protein n=1 Tax=Nisaea acidiphila TaxID=1862145 RepID=A0A9J7AST5_9PROT|nr:glycosyltransferase family 39 protein [Nisaea acidiphila]UUX48421.1 glycosyltransferase family 39 protein [Nisaea acidiphila]
MQTVTSDREQPYFLWLLIALAALTAARLAVLGFSTLGLHGDEAQYWSWSRDLAWGYYTKPPLIAFVISAAEAICGDGTACIRAPSPPLHAGTSLAIYGIAVSLTGSRRTGFWSGLSFATLPAASLSSFLISTDVPLLFLWAVALLAFVRSLESDALGWPLLLGLAAGAGFLAKYAMAYFVFGLLLVTLATPTHRAWLTSRKALVALVATLAVFAPNLLWNIESGWVTFTHVGQNTNLKGDLFHIGKMLEFVGSQAGVFGPVLFAALLWRLAVLRRDPAGGTERLLLAFCLPVLAIITVQSFLSRANANWAATAYVSATILTVGWLLRRKLVKLVAAGIGLNLLATAVLGFFFLNLPGVEVPLKKDPLRRLRAWDAVADQLRPVLAAHPGAIWLTEDRKTMASLLYALRDLKRRPLMWDYDGHPDHHYELAERYQPQPGDTVLLVAKWDDPFPILERFSTVQKLPAITVEVGADQLRQLNLFLLSGPIPSD